MAELMMTIGISGVLCMIAFPAIKTAAWNAQRDALVRASYSKLTEAFTLAADDLEYTPKCAYWGSKGLGASPHTYTVVTTVNPETGEKSWKQENGEPLASTHNGVFTDCSALGKAVIKRLHVKQECYGNALAKGCIPKYDGNDSTDKWNGSGEIEAVTSTSGMDGFRTSNIHNKNHAFVFTHLQEISP